MNTSQAVHEGSYDATDIDRLKVHAIVDDHARCDPKLGAISLMGMLRRNHSGARIVKTWE